MPRRELDLEGVRDLLRAEVKLAGTISEWARRAGVSKAYVADILGGKRDPGPAVLEVLGVEVRQVYSRIREPSARSPSGFTPGRSGRPAKQ
jgi:hypothetical protein